MAMNGSGRPRRESANGSRLIVKEFLKSTKGPSQAKIATPMDPPGMGLTIAQGLWVHHFMECLCQTEAARRCGYGDPARKPDPAILAGAKMMANPKIRAAIASKLAKCSMSSEELLVRTTELARSTPECVISFDHNDQPYIDLCKVRREGKWHWIKSIKWTRYGLNVELHSAIDAQDRLMRIHGMYQNRLTVTHKIDYTQVPDTPRHQALLEAVARGEIDELEFSRQVQALDYSPSAPLVIDSEKGVPDLTGNGSDYPETRSG